MNDVSCVAVATFAAQDSSRTLSRALDAFARCSAALVHATREPELLSEICRIMVQSAGFRMAWVGYADRGDKKAVHPVAQCGYEAGYLDLADITWDESERGQGPTGTAIRTGNAQVNQNALTNPRMTPWRSEALKRGYASSVAIPLKNHQGPFGALTLYAHDADAFDTAELDLLQRLAAELSYGIMALRARDERDQMAKGLEASERRYRSIFEHAVAGIFKTDADGHVLAANPAIARILGYDSPEQMVELVDDASSVIYADPADDALMASLLHSGNVIRDSETRMRRRDGELIWVSQSVSSLNDEATGAPCLLVMAEDISQRKQAEERITRLTRVHTVLSGVNAAIVRIRDRQELFQEFCRIATEAGRFAVAWIGVVDRERGVVQPVASAGDVGNFLESTPLAVVKEASGRRGFAGRAVTTMRPMIANDVPNEPHLLMRRELAQRGIHSLAVLPLIVGNEAVGVLALYAKDAGVFDQDEMRLLNELAGDIAFALEHIDKAEKLNYLAYHDVPTGIPNGAHFRERLEHHVDAARSARQKVAVIMFDVERFNSVNDALGRQAGDDLLRQIAARLVNAVGDSSRLARIGTDHFAVIEPMVESEGQLARLTERWLGQCFGAPYRIGESDLGVAAKVGIAMFPSDGNDADVLYRNAEAALKKAKMSTERYLFYTQQMTEQVAEKLALENCLRRALENDEFVLHYQPKVDLEQHIVGAEALVRWQSPDRGLILPLQFIPLMEETGLILDLGAWALKRASLDHRSWMEAGLNAPRVAVNVSLLQMQRRDFVDVVERAISGGATPTGIDLEITETMFMEDFQVNIEKLQALRKLGLQIAIDDFGTGYSSLSYLARLPVQSLKIDRSFIVAMIDDANVMTLISTIVSLAHSLRLKVVAEGVETDEQAKFLRLLRCDEMQGFLFSKPLPEPLFAELLRNRK